MPSDCRKIVAGLLIHVTTRTGRQVPIRVRVHHKSSIEILEQKELRTHINTQSYTRQLRSNVVFALVSACVEVCSKAVGNSALNLKQGTTKPGERICALLLVYSITSVAAVSHSHRCCIISEGRIYTGHAFCQG